MNVELTPPEYVIETDLTEEEKELIRQGEEEYAKGNFVTLESILADD